MEIQNKFDTRNLKIAHWNANGIKENITEIKHFINEYKIDVMLISETKLCSGTKIRIPGYNIYSKERDTNTHGGGVLIAIKNIINCTEVNFNTTSMETIGIQINHELTIAVGYLRPQNRINTLELDSIFEASSSVILMGDFNSRHRSWNCHKANANGNALFKHLQNKQ